MSIRTIIRDVVAWTLVALALLVIIGAMTREPTQHGFVECIEATRWAFPAAQFDEINAHCTQGIGLLD